MKKFVILEKYVGYADITIEAETEQEAIDLYNEGSYDDNATEYDDMFYDFEFVNQKVESIVDASVDYQDSEILEDWEDLFDVHTLLEETA